MSNDFDLTTETSSGTAPTVDYPTVDVAYPDGETEQVDPEYDIFVATNAETELGCDFDETRVSRLELTEFAIEGNFDKQHIQHDLGDAIGTFEAEYGYPQANLCVELAYFRIVDGAKTLCVQLRGEATEKRLLSQFVLHVDERLRNEF